MPLLVSLQIARLYVRYLLVRMRLLRLRTWQRITIAVTSRPRSAQADLGQTTAEYGLVILAAGTLALAAILWARNSGSITDLFQNVIDQLTGNLSG